MPRRSQSPAATSRVVVQRARGQGFTWPEELAALLGKIPDEQLAKKAGVHKDTVAAERRRRGIEACQAHQRRVWTPEMIAQIGTDSDRKVARTLGLPRACVKRMRECLRIPPYYPPPHEPVQRVLWEPEDLVLLGKMPDSEVAKRLGISATTIARKRQALKIPPFRPALPPVKWTAEMVASLGRVPDRQVALLYGISVSAVVRKRERLGIPGAVDLHGRVVPTPELVELLRQESTEVRRRTGLSWQTIRSLRKRLGIAAPDPWTPQVLARLGMEPDPHIARDIGFSPAGVRKRRMALGIAAFYTPRRWQPEEIKLLGTASDEEIARTLDRSVRSVRGKRSKLRLP